MALNNASLAAVLNHLRLVKIARFAPVRLVHFGLASFGERGAWISPDYPDYPD